MKTIVNKSIGILGWFFLIMSLIFCLIQYFGDFNDSGWNLVTAFGVLSIALFIYKK